MLALGNSNLGLNLSYHDPVWADDGSAGGATVVLPSESVPWGLIALVAALFFLDLE